jgi:hypothetical protein
MCPETDRPSRLALDPMRQRRLEQRGQLLTGQRVIVGRVGLARFRSAPPPPGIQQRVDRDQLILCSLRQHARQDTHVLADVR